VIRKAIAAGIEKKYFGYMAGPVPTLGPDNRYQLSTDKVQFGRQVSDDEIDLESGFLMMPSAIPQITPTIPVTPPMSGGPSIIVGEEHPLPATGGTTVTPTPALQQNVDLSFQGDRNQLYTAWNAIANLADMAGKVTVTVHAEREKGFDKNTLKNGVLEPLKEANLIE
jgi:hypothetical protein